MRDNGFFGWLRALFGGEKAANNGQSGTTGTAASQAVIVHHGTQDIMAAQATENNNDVHISIASRFFGWMGTFFTREKAATNDEEAGNVQPGATVTATTMTKMRDNCFVRWLKALFGRKKAATNDIEANNSQSGTAGTATAMSKTRDNCFARWLMVLFGQKKAAMNDNETNSGQSRTMITHHTTHDLMALREPSQKGKARIMTIAEMAATANPQLFCYFFVNLPLEIRRKIYHEVWRMWLKPRRVAAGTPGSDLRLHIYAPNRITMQLQHTPCVVHPGEPAQKDEHINRRWPFDAAQPAHPQLDPEQHERPDWFFKAWVLRLSWGKHWKCQQVIQKRWLPLEGGFSGIVSKEMKAPILPVFLTCKNMYFEAAQSFFETVTLVFTSSLTVDHFFNQQQPRTPFLAHLRNLELNMSHSTDHLFLTEINYHPTATRESGPVVTARVIRRNGHAGSLTISCANGVPAFGAQLWDNMVRGIRDVAPDLRDLEVYFGGRVDRARFLQVFGTLAEDEDAITPAPVAGGESSSSVGAALTRCHEMGGVSESDMWELPGKFVITFVVSRVKTRFKQVGRSIVPMAEEV